MDGTASGKEHPGVNARAALLAGAVALLAACASGAQTPGASSFRILQKGTPIGSLELSVTRDADGWRVWSTGAAKGTIGVNVKQFDAEYDSNWRGRFLTVERTGPRSSTLMHVVVGRTTAHVDIVTAKEARWHSHSTSPDVVFLPAHAYGAFAAVAARLNAAGPRAEMPLLLVPDSERRAVVDAWEPMTVETGRGQVRADRHTLTLIGAIPEQLHVWEAGGDLLRVDIPRDEISVVRTDLRQTP